MKTFYFTVGKFCAQGMGYNYTGHGCKFISIDSENYDNAINEVSTYAEHIFGKNEYKDMWYGQYAYIWEVTPHTEISWKQEYNKIFNELKYHYEHASKIFNDETDYQKLHHNFYSNYPVLHIDENKNITAVSIEMENIKKKEEIKEPVTIKHISKPEETKEIKEFFE